MQTDRIEWHLHNWAEYMRRPTHKLGYPSKSLCLSSGGSSGADEFEIMCDNADASSAQAIDSIIDSISQPQRIAVNHEWLKTNHHYPTHLMDYDEAIQSISRIADKRGLI